MRAWRKWSRDVITSERHALVSYEARWLWALLWADQDDEGRYPWTPTKIRALTVGTNWSREDADRHLQAICAHGLAAMADGFVVLAGGAELNGTPSNSRNHPMLYPLDSVAAPMLAELPAAPESPLESPETDVGEETHQLPAIMARLGEEFPSIASLKPPSLRHMSKAVREAVDAGVDVELTTEKLLAHLLDRKDKRPIGWAKQFVQWYGGDAKRIREGRSNGRVVPGRNIPAANPEPSSADRRRALDRLGSLGERRAQELVP